MKRPRHGTPITRRDLLTKLMAAAVALPGGRTLARLTGRTALAPLWNDNFEAAITFEINQSISLVHRPYLAVWIEDAAGDAVRTIALWIGSHGREERYLRELRRWLHDEELRKAKNGGDLVETVSSATRVAGVYTVVWDGENDAGKLVEQGDYFVCIECSRQNGTYQLIHQQFTFGAQPFYAPVKGNYEIIGVSVDYRQRK